MVCLPCERKSHMFFDGWDLRTFDRSPYDVASCRVSLLSRCTLAASEAMNLSDIFEGMQEDAFQNVFSWI